MRTRVVWAIVAAVTLIPSLAFAAWPSSATGTSSVSPAVTVNMGNTPGTTVSGATVTLSWPASTLSNGTPVTGYVIKRYDSAGTTLLSIGAGTCSTTVSGTSCTHTSAPEGTWRYSVTPAHNNWRGTESSKAPATVDLTPPPVPTITSNPPSSTTSASATFGFSDAESGVSFECQIDTGAFTSCASPKSYSALTAASHTFTVRALDAAGNPSAAATYTWTVIPCTIVNMVSGSNFSPSAASVAVGCWVTWTNTVNATHTTTSDTGLWSSGPMGNGVSFPHQFTSAGTFTYKCMIHPSMTGTVTVN